MLTQCGRAWAFACISCILLWATPSLAEPLAVTVVQSERSGAYDDFSAALRENLLENNVTLTIQDSTQALPHSDLVIAVGMKAANAAASSNAASVLNVMIPKSGHKKLLRDFPKRENSPRFSAIYLDQPVERQLSLIASAFPDRNRIGILFDSPPPEELDQIRQKAAEYGLKLYEQETGEHKPLFGALQNVLQHSDVLLAIPAPTVYNSSTLRNILVSTYQARIPLVGFSSAYTRAGATCAVFSTPAHFAAQTGTTILRFIATGALPSAQYPKFYEVAVNDRVAQSLGIDIKAPDELVRSMATIRRRAP